MGFDFQKPLFNDIPKDFFQLSSAKFCKGYIWAYNLPQHDINIPPMAFESVLKKLIFPNF